DGVVKADDLLLEHLAHTARRAGAGVGRQVECEQEARTVGLLARARRTFDPLTNGLGEAVVVERDDLDRPLLLKPAERSDLGGEGPELARRQPGPPRRSAEMELGRATSDGRSNEYGRNGRCAIHDIPKSSTAMREVSRPPSGGSVVLGHRRTQSR